MKLLSGVYHKMIIAVGQHTNTFCGTEMVNILFNFKLFSFLGLRQLLHTAHHSRVSVAQHRKR